MVRANKTNDNGRNILWSLYLRNNTNASKKIEIATFDSMPILESPIAQGENAAKNIDE